ncbi:MAG: MoaD/ThiS family protein [Pseudomonadota bacterium]
MIRVTLPMHLQVLAGVRHEITLNVDGPVTQRSVLDALESRYPMLRGTVREHGTERRRPRVRFFADSLDVTHDDPDKPLPDAVRNGQQAFMIVGAVAGG